MQLVECKKGNIQPPTIWILIINIDNLSIFNLWNCRLSTKLKQPLHKWSEKKERTRKWKCSKSSSAHKKWF